MNVIKLVVLLFCSLVFGANAQLTSDLGMIYGTNDLYRMNIEFRKPINDIYKLKFGYIQGSNSSLFLNYQGELTTVSDSLIVERFKSGSQLQFTLFTGIEKRLKASMFSISADLLVSYLQVKDGYYNEERELSDSGNWVTLKSIDFEESSPSLRKINFINPGFQFKFSMDIPIEESFLLHLFVGQIISLPIYLSETIIKDPMSEFQPQSKLFSLSSTSQAGIGLRYRFKK